MTQQELKTLEKQIRSEVDEALRLAQADQPPTPESAFQGVHTEEVFVRGMELGESHSPTGEPDSPAGSGAGGAEDRTSLAKGLEVWKPISPRVCNTVA